jgi:hypothetical protein
LIYIYNMANLYPKTQRQGGMGIFIFSVPHPIYTVFDIVFCLIIL